MSELEPKIPPEELVEVETPLGRLTLHYSMAAWVRYQRTTGHSILREPVTQAHLDDTERWMLILHLGLGTFHPEVSLEDLERTLTLRDVERLRPAVVQAITATSPVLEDEEEEGEEEDPPAARS